MVTPAWETGEAPGVSATFATDHSVSRGPRMGSSERPAWQAAACPERDGPRLAKRRRRVVGRAVEASAVLEALEAAVAQVPLLRTACRPGGRGGRGR